MKKKQSVKQKYLPCELCVVEFNVERGFACSNSFQGSINPGPEPQAATYMLWSMSSQTGSDNIQHYRNEAYQDDFSWF